MQTPKGCRRPWLMTECDVADDVAQVEMMNAKKSGAGHAMYKVCRRVLVAPIVDENKYCKKVTKNGLCKGEGEKNKAGEPHGHGIMVYANGNMYDGQWANGARHGEGTCKYATGDVYEGQWKDSNKHGKGVYKYASGSKYVGQFQNGNNEGRGIMLCTPPPSITNHKHCQRRQQHEHAPRASHHHRLTQMLTAASTMGSGPMTTKTAKAS